MDTRSLQGEARAELDSLDFDAADLNFDSADVNFDSVDFNFDSFEWNFNYAARVMIATARLHRSALVRMAQKEHTHC